jgi:glutaredoxin
MSLLRTSLCLSMLLGASLHAAAQYKVIDGNGRVTYTDRPPITSNDKIQPMRATGGPAAATSNLPFELRQVAERYPVTLFTGDACEPCLTAKTLLRQRGIPYTEKTVKTDADIAAFKRAEASGELPVLRIGAQQLKGYNDAEWVSYLDAAGYPKQSQLPPSYKAPDATPLVEAKPVPAAPAAAAQAQRPAALPPALETAPSGIRF